MPVTTIVLITLAAILALGFVVFKYFWGNKSPGRNIYILAGLRFISIFVLLVLLINPGITQREIEIEKPVLFIAVDESASIAYADKEDEVRSFVNELRGDSELNDKFSVQTYGFGAEVYKLESDSLAFNRPQTNINRALRDLERLNREKQTAIVIVTDGNQTIGEDYIYYRPGGNTAVYPVVAGDTTVYSDLYISNLNVNNYAFLNNNFPVEVIVNYSGREAVETIFELRAGNSVLFSQRVRFTPENPSEIIKTSLQANSLGTSVYSAVLQPLPDEKNTVNNSRKFAVEVIDERTSILILSSIAHPDLGMLKKSIEQNEQREAVIKYIDDFNSVDIADFQLVILYQPNNLFRQVFEDINAIDSHSWIITGSKTDWRFLNSIQQNFSKDHTSQTQEIFPVYNNNFTQFQFEDPGFGRYPPLEDVFGSITVNNQSFSPLLFQQLERVETGEPLLATYTENSAKRAVLFGENIWKWRTQSFVDTGSFEEFDTFTSRLIQFLASTRQRDRLTFSVESIYLENENVGITARFYDQNFLFNPQGQLMVRLENTETGEIIESSMLPGENRFTLELEDLSPGDYTFVISEQTSGISRQGSFVVLEYNVEQQFGTANLEAMRQMANNNDRNLLYLDNAGALIDNLLSDDSYVLVQKSREKTLPLVNWKFLLALLAISLGAEWFMRKYFGLI